MDAVSTINELLKEWGNADVHTREEFNADHARIVAAIAAKHGIAESEVAALVREHRYQHSADGIEDEYIQAVCFARSAGWLS